MEKTLVYHLYVKEDFDENVAYKVHSYCLKKYVNIFDKVKFTLSVDDLTNHSLICKGLKWINNIGINCETQINVIKNGELGETETFQREILNMNNDGMVFFAHSKGVGRLINNKINSSVLIWVLLLYFENFANVNEIEKCFLDMPLHSAIFYGTMLIGSVRNEPLTKAFGMHYSGNFFWVNMPKYKNWRKIGRIPDLEPDGRWFTEIYPNMVCNFEMMGGGIATRDNIWFEMETVQAYNMNREEWENIFYTYQNNMGMSNLIDELYEVIGVENIDFGNKTEWDDKV